MSAATYKHTRHGIKHGPLHDHDLPAPDDYRETTR
jgi:hypothetical protein